MSCPPDPTPVAAFDIFEDGTAQASADVHSHPAPDALFRWLHFDLSDPNFELWATAALPPLACRTLLASRTRPRVDVHNDGLVLTVRGINLNAGEEQEDMVSLRLWATAELVVTVRRQKIFALDDVKNQILAGDPPRSPIHLIARITERLVDRIETLSLDLEDRAELMENEVYDTETPIPPDLGQMRRRVITLRRHIGPMSDALGEFAHIDTPLIDASTRNRLRHTASRAKRSVDEVHEVADRLSALADHIELQQDQRLAHNSYKLSIIAAIFLPLGFITGLFGVNVAGMPGVDDPYAFAILCAAMAVIGILIYFIFRWIRWF